MSFHGVKHMYYISYTVICFTSKLLNCYKGNIWTIVGWSNMKFGKNIHVSQRRKLSLVITWPFPERHQQVWVFITYPISTFRPDQTNKHKSSADIHGPKRMKSNHFGHPLTFYLGPSSGDNFVIFQYESYWKMTKLWPDVILYGQIQVLGRAGTKITLFR